MKKRIVVCSDLHCGHRAGLTPPAWHTDAERGRGWDVAARLQRETWAWYDKTCRELKPDIAIWNGDMCDGKGERSGSTEQITTDRGEQVEMAAICIQRMRAKKNLITYGTPYHGGVNEDWEDQLLLHDIENPAVGGWLWPEINGVTFDVRHHSGGSTIPHGRATAILREELWNLIWSDREEQPKADIFIRSHCHFFMMVDDGRCMAFRTPALQAAFTKYGRRCSGTVDFGLLVLDITDKGEVTWQRRLLRPAAAKAHKLMC